MWRPDPSSNASRHASDASAARTFDAGPAAGVRWDLSDLFDGPDDPELEASLDRSLESALAFAARYRGKL